MTDQTDMTSMGRGTVNLGIARWYGRLVLFEKSGESKKMVSRRLRSRLAPA
jgi:hypothetical protein